MSDNPIKHTKPRKVPLFTKSFVGIFIINLILFVSFQMTLPSIPIFASTLKANASIIGLVVSVFTITAIIGRPIGGVLLDRYGRKPVFIVSLVLFGVFLFMYGLATSIIALLIFRLIHGLFWGVVSTGSNTIASDTIPKQRFGEGMGYFTLSTSLAMAVGPALGLHVVETYNFKMVTYVACLILFIAFVLSFIITYENSGKVPLPSANKSSNKIPKEKKSETLKSRFNKIIEPQAVQPAIIVLFVTAGLGGINSFIALFAYDKGIDNVALYFLAFSIAMIITRPIAGKTLDRLGAIYVLAPALVLTVIGLVNLSFANTLTRIMITGVIYGIGFASTQTALQACAVAEAPPNRRGAANGTFFIGFDAGIGLGAFFGGMIAEATSYSVMYLIFAALSAFALIYYLYAHKHKAMW